MRHETYDHNHKYHNLPKLSSFNELKKDYENRIIQTPLSFNKYVNVPISTKINDYDKGRQIGKTLKPKELRKILKDIHTSRYGVKESTALIYGIQDSLRKKENEEFDLDEVNNLRNFRAIDLQRRIQLNNIRIQQKMAENQQKEQFKQLSQIPLREKRMSPFSRTDSFTNTGY